jgi:hypothetical protein
LPAYDPVRRMTVTPTMSDVGIRSGDGAAAWGRVRLRILSDSRVESVYLEFKAIDADRYRTDHARIEFLVVACVLGGTDVDEFPFQVYRAQASYAQVTLLTRETRTVF